MQKKTLIYGGGAIGSFMAACLRKSNHKIFFCVEKKIIIKLKAKEFNDLIYISEKIFLTLGDIQTFFISFLKLSTNFFFCEKTSLIGNPLCM